MDFIVLNNCNVVLKNVLQDGKKMKLGITILGIALILLGLFMVFIGVIPSNIFTVMSNRIVTPDLKHLIIIAIGIIFVLVGIADIAYSALSPMKVKQ